MDIMNYILNLPKTCRRDLGNHLHRLYACMFNDLYWNKTLKRFTKPGNFSEWEQCLISVRTASDLDKLRSEASAASGVDASELKLPDFVLVVNIFPGDEIPSCCLFDSSGKYDNTMYRICSRGNAAIEAHNLRYLERELYRGGMAKKDWPRWGDEDWERGRISDTGMRSNY